MYEDNPSVRVYNNLLQAMYHYHPVREKIAGTIESVAAITPRILYRCHSTLLPSGEHDPICHRQY